MPSSIAEVHVSGDDVILVPTLRSIPEAHFVVQYQATADEFGLVVDGVSLAAFEAAIADDPTVARTERLADFGATRIYQVYRAGDRRGISERLADLHIQVLGTTSEPGDDGWVFRLRCRDRASLATFREWAQGHGLEIRLEALYTESAPGRPGPSLEPRTSGLTDRQREVLEVAYERGYFRIPREVSLDELGEELGVTGSTASGILRRAIASLVATHVDD